MERATEPSLLGIPAENRNQILQLVLYHEETAGIISPRQDYVYNGFSVSVSGHRFLMRDDQTLDLPPSWLPPTAQHTSGLQRAWYVWKNSANKASNHTCTLNCLVQPAISLVNRQLRDESLPVFYGNNIFHLEMANFELSKNDIARDLNRCPVDWWRAIGDANLRKIRRFALVGQAHHGQDKYGGVQVRYKSECGTAMRNVAGRVRSRADGIEERDLEERKSQIQAGLDILAGEDLNIEAIERIVTCLEPRGTRYLRDRNRIVAGEAGGSQEFDDYGTWY